MQLGKRILPALVLLMGTSAFGSLANSPHDLTTLSTGPLAANVIGANGICLPCHTPHNPESGVVQADAPLWNHEVALAANFSTYTTLAGNTAGEVDGPSRLCLGCHDGVTALDSYGGATGSTLMTDPGGVRGVIVGTDLSDDHPVGVPYPVNSEFVAAATVTTNGLKLYDVGGLRVECQSCHDPHDTTNAPFLRVSNADSALCLACHLK